LRAEGQGLGFAVIAGFSDCRWQVRIGVQVFVRGGGDGKGRVRGMFGRGPREGLLVRCIRGVCVWEVCVCVWEVCAYGRYVRGVCA